MKEEIIKSEDVKKEGTVFFKEEDCNDRYRVCHFPQVPCEPFFIYCESLDECINFCKVLWNYDIFQFENSIKPDYANSTMIEYYDNELDCWTTFYTEDGEDIMDLI